MLALNGIPDLVEQGDYVCKRFSEERIKKYPSYLISGVALECEHIAKHDITFNMYSYLSERINELKA